MNNIWMKSWMAKMIREAFRTSFLMNKDSEESKRLVLYLLVLAVGFRLRGLHQSRFVEGQ